MLTSTVLRTRVGMKAVYTNTGLAPEKASIECDWIILRKSETIYEITFAELKGKAA